MHFPMTLVKIGSLKVNTPRSNFRHLHDTYFYQVTSISDQQLFTYCVDTRKYTSVGSLQGHLIDLEATWGL